MRETFITVRCFDQYKGYIKHRLGRAEQEMDKGENASLKKVSKYLYAAYHKLDEATRLHCGGLPNVLSEGDARRKIMRIRTSPLVGLTPGLLQCLAYCLAYSHFNHINFVLHGPSNAPCYMAIIT